MEPKDDDAHSMDTEIKRATLAKLQEETGQIARTGNLNYQLVSAVPLLTVLLTVASLVGGAVGYFYDRASQRSAQRDQIARQSIDRIFKFKSDQNVTVGEIIYVSRDLHEILKRDETRLAAATEAIRDLTEKELDYNVTRNVAFLSAMLVNWPPLSAGMSDRHEAELLLYKLVRVFQRIASQDKEYFRTIKYTQEEGYQVPRYTDEPRYLQFIELVDASRRVLAATRDPEVTGAFRREFEKALDNPGLASQVFSDSKSPHGR